MGISLENRSGGVHHSNGVLHSPFLHTDGFHRQFYWNDVELHLALLFPLEIEKERYGCKNGTVGLFYYIFRVFIRYHWNI